MPKPIRVHLVAEGFPPGSFAGNDMDYARLRLLGLLQENSQVLTTSANDFTDVAKWLPDSHFLITYVAGPCDRRDAVQCHQSQSSGIADDRSHPDQLERDARHA